MLDLSLLHFQNLFANFRALINISRLKSSIVVGSLSKTDPLV